VSDHAQRVQAALAHLASLSGDPDELYVHAANYALRLSSTGGTGVRAYVADLEEPEEDEMAATFEEPGEGEEPAVAAETETDETEDTGSIPEPGEPEYGKFFFRYVAVAAAKGDDQNFLVGKKLERGVGVSFCMVDNTPKQPWIDIQHVMTYRGPPLETREGDEPTDPDAPPPPAKVHFVGGFPRAGAFFAVPIVLVTGEVAGMLCLDSVKTLGGGNGLAIPDTDKDWVRLVAAAAATAMDAAAAQRRATLLQARDEQTAIVAAIAAAEAPDESEAAEGEAPKENEADAEPEPEEEAPPEPEEGVEMSDEDTIKALEFKKRDREKRLAVAEVALLATQKRLALVAHLVDLVDETALGEIRSAPRAPKQTWRVVKAGLYAAGFKKFEFDTWSLTRKLLGGEFRTKLQNLNPNDVTKRDAKAWAGVHKCLAGVTANAVVRESKVGAVLHRWVDAFVAVSDATLEVTELKTAIEDFENEVEKTQERIAEVVADAEAAAEAEAAAGGAEAEAEETTAS
jgi:hypothetical protein|tara:strand:+ start:4581 stop:6122 length:1542 start_codon:yes stop_codon:yes gene_type:complete